MTTSSRSATRRPEAKRRSKSLALRSESNVRTFRWPRPRALDSQTAASTSPPAGDDPPPAGGLHAVTEAVPSLPPTLLGLVRSFHGRVLRRREDSSSPSLSTESGAASMPRRRDQASQLVAAGKGQYSTDAGGEARTAAPADATGSRPGRPAPTAARSRAPAATRSCRTSPSLRFPGRHPNRRLVRTAPRSPRPCSTRGRSGTEPSLPGCSAGQERRTDEGRPTPHQSHAAQEGRDEHG